MKKLIENKQKVDEWIEHWEKGKHELTWIGKQLLKLKQKPLEKIILRTKPVNAIDVGCALGYILSVFKNNNINAVGIDVSRVAVDICKNKGLIAYRKNLENINKKYEFVFSDGLLEHFLNFESYIKKMTEISNKYVCIIQTDHGSLLGKILAYLAEILRTSNNVLEYNYRIEDFVLIFKKNNFELIKKENISFGIFKLLLFQKK